MSEVSYLEFLCKMCLCETLILTDHTRKYKHPVHHDIWLDGLKKLVKGETNEV